MIKYKYIAIEGNIGAGKTTLSKFLAKHLNASLLLEEFEENYFLKEFYKGRDFAIHSELQFILDRSRQLSEFFSKKHQLIISDYVPQKSLIFSEMNLPNNEFNIIEDLTNILYKPFIKADLLIFIDSSSEQLMKNIIKRARVYERNINEEYLERLTTCYEKWISNLKIPVLRIKSDEINLKNPKDLTAAFKILFSNDYQNCQREISLKSLINSSLVD